MVDIPPDELRAALDLLTAMPVLKEVFLREIATRLPHLPAGRAMSISEQLLRVGAIKDTLTPLHFHIDERGIARLQPQRPTVSLTTVGRDLFARTTESAEADYRE